MRALHLDAPFLTIWFVKITGYFSNKLIDIPAEAVKPTSSKFVVLFLVLIALPKIAFCCALHPDTLHQVTRALLNLYIHKKSFESY
jgi:hypothetical protein